MKIVSGIAAMIAVASGSILATMPAASEARAKVQKPRLVVIDVESFRRILP